MSQDIEIELKLPLLNGKEVKKFLAENAVFKYESKQHDKYFNSPHRNFLEVKDNVNEWLRIRITKDKAQVNYKDWQPHEAKIKSHAIEFETEVASYDQLKKIFDALNFNELIDVNKTRRSWDYKDTEISLDEVEGLGSFIEVEYKGKLQDIEKARQHLYKVLKDIGAKTGELEVKGYPHMLLSKYGKI